MPERDAVDPGAYVGDWRKIDRHVYASYVIPSKMPTWMPFYMDGLVGIFLGLFVVTRYQGGPWAVVIYRTRRGRSFRIPVVSRREFADLAEANAWAEAMDSELCEGRVPGQP